MRAFLDMGILLCTRVWDISSGRHCAYSHWAVTGRNLVKREGNAHMFLQMSSYTCKQITLVCTEEILCVRG